MDRRISAWILKNCNRESCYLVLHEIARIIDIPNVTVHSPDRGIVPRSEIPLSQETIRYVYLAISSADRITVLARDHAYYYYLDGREIDEVAQTEIRYNVSLEALLQSLSKKMLQRLTINLSKAQKFDKLESVYSFDFALTDPKEHPKLLQKVMERNSTKLDLSHIHNVSFEGLKGNHFEVVLYQNGPNLGSLSWLRKENFPNVNSVALWSLPTLTNEDVELLCRNPNLDMIEINRCDGLDGRILLAVGASKLRRFTIVDELLSLHPEPSVTVIKDDEWKGIHNNTLQELIINSKNMTVDVLQQIVTHFSALCHIVVTEPVLERLAKGTRDGSRRERIVFHAFENQKRGFTRTYDMDYTELVRNRIGNSFTLSMLNIIKKNNPELGSAVDVLKEGKKI